MAAWPSLTEAMPLDVVSESWPSLSKMSVVKGSLKAEGKSRSLTQTAAWPITGTPGNNWNTGKTSWAAKLLQNLTEPEALPVSAPTSRPSLREQRARAFCPDTYWAVWVGNLPPGTQVAELEAAFLKFGSMINCIVKSQSRPGASDLGFVNFWFKDNAKEAASKMNGQWLVQGAARGAPRSQPLLTRPPQEKVTPPMLLPLWNEMCQRNADFFGNASSANVCIPGVIVISFIACGVTYSVVHFWRNSSTLRKEPLLGAHAQYLT
eukprot:gnl/MRDRNA2_/MRDRNA2_61950_c0_seq1.p1 gnl/MRDRNA2_/MRDRNA2_61950_c0~~gnl/MRDRNA2_/MRDRNA2_61950_c0_seq1.p1  ORF type:complete len:301 (+),score=51.45 gnl/MRDRNA2_/MRDRNA2_61950_c0_seq1:113-904(+)